MTVSPDDTGSVGPKSQRGVAGQSTPPPVAGVKTTTNPAAAPWTAPNGAWFPRAEQGFVDTNSPQGIDFASDYNSPMYNQSYTQADLEGILNAPETNKGLFELVAAGRGHNATANGVLQAYITESARLGEQGERVTPQELAYKEALAEGWIKDGQVTIDTGGGSGSGSGGGGGGGGGSYSSTSTSFATKGDIRALANQVGQSLIGRVLTDAELELAMSSIRDAEAANPTVTTGTRSGSGTSSQTVAGLSGSDRQDIVRDILVDNPEFIPYQMDTTVMDAMLSHINKGREIARG